MQRFLHHAAASSPVDVRLEICGENRKDRGDVSPRPHSSAHTVHPIPPCDA